MSTSTLSDGVTSTQHGEIEALTDLVLDTTALANELSQSAQQFHRETKFYINLTRASLFSSVACLALAGRLYYILHHAPLRHAWRIKEAKRRVPQFQKGMLLAGCTGLAGMIFTLSPAGFPQHVTRLRRNAEERDALAMRCLVLREQTKSLWVIGQHNHYVQGAPSASNAESCTGSPPLALPEPVFEREKIMIENPIVIRIPEWSTEYCFEQQKQVSTSLSASASRWARVKDKLFVTLGSSPVLLSPPMESVQAEWEWGHLVSLGFRRTTDNRYTLMKKKEQSCLSSSDIGDDSAGRINPEVQVQDFGPYGVSEAFSRQEWNRCVRALQELWKQSILTPYEMVKKSSRSDF